MIGFVPLGIIFSLGKIVIKMFIVVCRLFAFDLSPHGVGMALGSVANIGKINCCGVGYFLQKIGYFLHFCPFPGVFGGDCGKLAECAKNGNAFRVLRDAM